LEAAKSGLFHVTVSEIEEALRSLPSGKAASNPVNVDLLKAGGNSILSSLQELFSMFTSVNMVPKDFSKGVIVPIYKKGSKTDPGNFRGITLMDSVSKLYSKVLLNRISPYLEAHIISDEQGGFRKERRCEDQIFSLYDSVRRRKRLGKPTFMLFVDFRKAFDTVNRSILFQKLLDNGVEPNLVRLIQSLYKDHTAMVRVNGELSKSFPIQMGVKQGCVLSPDLFKIYVNDLVPRLEACNSGINVSKLHLSSLLFADDLVLTSGSERGLQELANVLDTWSTENDLSINMDKTKVMVVGKSRSPKVYLGNSLVDVCEKYQYLGLPFRADLSWSSVFTNMLSMTKSRAAQLHPLFSNMDLTVRVKLCLYKALVLPLFTYGSGVWWFTPSQMLKLERVQLSCLKTILGTCRTTTTAAVLAESGVFPVETLQDIAKLKFVGHLTKAHHSRIVNKLYSLPLECKVERDPWRCKVRTLLAKYSLMSQLSNLENDNIHLDDWNSVVSASVRQYYCLSLQKQLSSAVKCSSLQDICLSPGVKPAPYLSLPWKLASFYFKLRSGSLRLEVESGRFNRVAREDRHCRLCSGHEVEDAHHFLLHCPRLAPERDTLFTDMEKIVDKSVLKSIGSDDDTMVLTLMGKPLEEVEDQSEFTAVIVKGLHNMWKRRCTLLHFPAPSPPTTVVDPDSNVPVTVVPLPGLHAHTDVRQSS
jgi:hypothetical protein